MRPWEVRADFSATVFTQHPVDGKEAAIMNIEALVCNYQSLLQVTIRSWNRYTSPMTKNWQGVPGQGGRGFSIKQQEPETPAAIVHR